MDNPNFQPYQQQQPISIYHPPVVIYNPTAPPPTAPPTEPQEVQSAKEPQTPPNCLEKCCQIIVVSIVIAICIVGGLLNELSPNIQYTCPVGFKLFTKTESCYKPFLELATFLEAQNRCFAIDGDLVSIRSEGEHDFVLDLITTASRYQHKKIESHYMHIGLVFNEMLNKWMWTSESHSMGYSNWLNGYPRNTTNTPCARMDIYYDERASNNNMYYGKWSNGLKTDQEYFVCEKLAIKKKIE